MDNSRFSSLIYRIIGKPERWHEDYIDVMHQILDETESFDDPDNFSELAFGDQIISRLRDKNEALAAFNALLDKSRFKMIILDDTFTPIYHNPNAEELYSQYVKQAEPAKLTDKLLAETKKAAELNAKTTRDGGPNAVCAVDCVDQNGEQIYLRSINNLSSADPEQNTFYVLLAIDQNRQENPLNSDLIAQYELTYKEQMVLTKLVHGKSIKEIASESFISENTVKTHLKAIFRKTDTKSQTDVLRLILTNESQALDSYFDSTSVMAANSPTQPDDKFITLSNGHVIAYRDYGPPDGRPLIVCHNGWGCRVTIPHGYEEMCQRTNRRIIIPDRPGYGKTDFRKDHPKNWNAMFSDFIDKLGLTEFDILGTVFGSAIAMDFAAQADPRLKKLILASPVFVNTAEDRKYLTGILAPTVRLVKASKRFAKEIYELWLKSITMNLAVHYRRMIESSIGSAEQALFAQQDTVNLMIDGFTQGCSTCLNGISTEMVHCVSPKNLDLSAITIPVDLWWGTEDNRISQEGVEHIAAQLPNAKLHIKEGYSEHIYYALFEEMIS